MKTKNLLFTRQTLAGTVHRAFGSMRLPNAAIAIAALVGLALSAPGQTDNFDTGTLNPSWETSVSSNYPASLTFVPDAFGGYALRMSATNSAVYETPGLQNTARAIAWRTDQTYPNNFYIAVDLVDWNSSPDRSTNDPVIGLIAHGTNVVLDPNVPEGRPYGIILASRYQANGGNTADNGTRGQLQIYSIADGMVWGPLAAGAQGDYTIDPGHKYRLVFTGTNQVDEFNNSTNFFYCGRVYDLLDLTHPLATIFCWEPYYPAFHYTSPDPNNPGGWSPAGYSGIFAIGYRDTSDVIHPMSCDITVDNFVASTDPPNSGANFPATPYGLPGVPQVVNRQPASFTNFYPATNGIIFNPTTLTTTNPINTNAIHLFLNSVEVTSSLVITGRTTNATVTFSGLASNVVYDARIELGDALGRKTTNMWTFDTFSDAYLGSPVCKNIECEDFDINSSFIDDPVPSGFTFATTYFNNQNPPFTWPWTGAINQGPTGYVNQPGVNANTNGGVGDFLDYDNHNRQFEADYRPIGSIGTEQGSGNFLYYQPGVGQAGWVEFDTQRQKYASVNPDLREYNVERTEGGEWMNYTRIFHSTNFYNVYLRHGCELSQQLSLDQVAPATTNLGTFTLTNAFSKSNFRYAPLLDSSGKLAVVNLDGTNTLRLTMAVPQREKYKQGLMLNYLALVPAVPQVYSAPQVTGPWTPELAMLVDTDHRRLTVPQNGAARYYRLGWHAQLHITGISLTGGNVVLSY